MSNTISSHVDNYNLERRIEMKAVLSKRNIKGDKANLYYENLSQIPESYIDAFKKIDSITKLAQFLNVDVSELDKILSALDSGDLYSKFTIPKRSGGRRTICAPAAELKVIQRNLANKLSDVYKNLNNYEILAKHVYGFIGEQNIVDNANCHLNSYVVLNIDLKNFFDNFTYYKVSYLFYVMLKFPKKVAEILTKLACYNGKLPQGSPCSPIITNLLCLHLDSKFIQLSKDTGIRYSRYADDISLSIEDKASEISEKAKFIKHIRLISKHKRIAEAPNLLNLKNLNEDEKKAYYWKYMSYIFDVADVIIFSEHLKINYKKIHFRGKSKRQEITGITVNEKLNVRRSYYRELRSILHHCQKDGIYGTAVEYIRRGYCKNPKFIKLAEADNEAAKKELVKWFRFVLKGKIDYVRQVKETTDKGKSTTYIYLKELYDSLSD